MRLISSHLVMFFLITIPLMGTAVKADNRVGDADNSGSLDPGDAGMVLARLHGLIDEFAISPLALADGDGDLDLFDAMLVGQAANGLRTVSGPGNLLSYSDPPNMSVESSLDPITVFWGVFSNYFGVAELTDGLEGSLSILPAGSSSTLSDPTRSSPRM